MWIQNTTLTSIIFGSDWIVDKTRILILPEMKIKNRKLDIIGTKGLVLMEIKKCQVWLD